MPYPVAAVRGRVFNQIGAAVFVGAYDDIPNIVAAYGMRRALSVYDGPIIRLRRDSDNDESDVAPVANGDLDTAFVADFLNGANGLCVTVYDLSGNGNHATQATAASQPLYVASGQNGRPVLRFDGANDYLRGAFGSLVSQPLSILAVAQLNATEIDNAVYSTIMEGDDVTNRVIVRKDRVADPDVWSIYAGGSLVNGGVATSDWNVWTVLFSGASSQFWINGLSQATGNAGANGIDGITIGANASLNEFWKDDIPELVVANAAWSTADRQAAEQAAADYWGISL